MKPTNLFSKNQSLLVWTAVILALLILPSPVALADLQEIEGRYVGAWTNLTFGSTGKAVIAIQVSGTNANLVFDMEGFVFGQGNAPVITMPGTALGEVIQIDSQGVSTFGDIKGSVDATHGTLTATLSNIPGGVIQQVTAVGTITNAIINLDYTVDFSSAPSSTNPANGVMTAFLIPPITITQANRQGTNLALQWTGGMAPFTVQQSTDLSQSVWTDAGVTTTNTAATLPLPPTGNVFFRVSGQ
jgi:hypothetical protein